MLGTNEANKCPTRVTDQGYETKIPCACQYLFQLMSNQLVTLSQFVSRDADIACDTHSIIWSREEDEIGLCNQYDGVIIRPEFNNTMTIYTNGTLVIYGVGFDDTNIYECRVFPGSSESYYTELIVRGEASYS